MRTTAILNLKGGVAKTVTCVNTAAILAADYGKRVLVVDADSQANTTEFFGGSEATQTLADLLTIHREKKHFDNLTIGFCGDLKFGRTVHSLCGAMARYPGSKFVLISPEELKLPSYVKRNVLDPAGIQYTQTTDLEDSMENLDILYMTRVQRERFFNEEDYLRLKDRYILTAEKMKKAPESMIVMHPLPRVNEISVAVDDDPRACYFKQVLNGKYMALIMKLLKEAGRL